MNQGHTNSVSHHQPPAGNKHDSGVPTRCCLCSVENAVCTLHKSWLDLQDKLIEKDHSINTLSDKVSQLAVHETESKRKDVVILSLREEITQLQKDVQERNTSVSTLDATLDSKRHSLLQMETNIFQLNETIESLKTKSSLAEKTIAALQTQLAHKSETLAMKSDELRELKKGRRCVEDNLSCSVEGMKEKQATVASLNDRVKRLKSLNEELKSKLEQKEAECTKLSIAERRLFDQVSQLKQKSNCVSSQLNSTRKQLTEVSHTNDDLASKAGGYREQLDTLCHQLKSLIGLHTSTSRSTSSDVNNIVTSVSQMVSGQLQLKQELNRSLEQLHETNERLTVIESDTGNINSCLATLKFPFANSVPMETMISGTLVMIDQQEIETDAVTMIKENLTKLLSQLKDMHHQLHSVREHVHRYKRAIEGEDSEGEEDGGDVTATVQKLCLKLEEYKMKYTQLQERLSVINEQKGDLMEQALVSLRKDNEKQMADKIDEVRTEEREQYARLCEELKNHHKEEQTKITEEWVLKLEEARRESALYQQELQQKGNELKCQSDNIQELKVTCQKIENERDKLKTKIEKMKKSMEDEYSVLQAHLKSQDQEHKRSNEHHNVQILQHSKTIASLSHRLDQSTEECRRLTSANKDLTSKVASLSEKLDTSQVDTDSEIKKCKGIIETMRRQLTLANEQSGKMRCELFEAEQALEEAKASFKAKIDGETNDHQLELEDLKKSFSNKEDNMTQLSHKLSETQGELKAQKQIVEQVNKEKQSLLVKLTELKEGTTSSSNTTLVQNGDHGSGEGEDTGTLALVGQRCLREQHNRIIKSQEHAIVDLRKRVNDLCSDKPLVPSHQDALKEIVQLRQTVNQMKSDEAIKQNRREYEEKQNKEKQSEAAFEESFLKDSIVSVHKLRDVEETLDLSEEAYGNLLNAVMSMCHIPENSIVSSKKLSETNKVGREHIMRDRDDFIKGQLVRSIRGLRRRDGQVKTDPDEVMSAPLPESPPETPDLTEFGVFPTKKIEKMDADRRLDKATIKRKDFIQSQREIVQRRLSHSCLMAPDVAQHQIDNTKREYAQKLKKKDKEITRLRKSLRESQQRGDVMASKIKLSIK